MPSNTLVRPAADVPRLLLTARETAEALAISPRTLWQLTAPRGPLRAIRVGGRGLQARALRYSIEDLREWIAAQANGRAVDARPLIVMPSVV